MCVIKFLRRKSKTAFFNRFNKGKINQVKRFVNLIEQIPFDVDVVSGRYTVDAKSMLGIYSLDLSKPIQVVIYSDNCKELKKSPTEFMP